MKAQAQKEGNGVEGAPFHFVGIFSHFCRLFTPLVVLFGLAISFKLFDDIRLAPFVNSRLTAQ